MNSGLCGSGRPMLVAGTAGGRTLKLVPALLVLGALVLVSPLRRAPMLDGRVQALPQTGSLEL